MASVEFIQKRIDGKEKELAKLTKKLERIRKVEAQNWEDPNPYMYSDYDLRITLKDIEDVQKALEGYKAQMVAETEKANSRNVPAIVEFLNNWKVRMYNFYKSSENGLITYFNEKEALHDLYGKINGWSYSLETASAEQVAYENARKAFRNKCRGYFEKQAYTNRWGKPDHKEVKTRDGEYEWLAHYTVEGTLEGALERLEKELTQEWNRKYDFIIERTNKIVGTITDASNLKVGMKGDLNGYIIGTKGVAKVQTIGAGGYNIQCFHFRTLIDPMK